MKNNINIKIDEIIPLDEEVNGLMEQKNILKTLNLEIIVHVQIVQEKKMFLAIFILEIKKS